MSTLVMYTYDTGGNIVQKSVYPYTISDNLDSSQVKEVLYSYRSNGWRDQLMSYNGSAIQYDNIGNPTRYKGNTLTWKYGRQLLAFGGNIKYTYNASGIRLGKTVGGVSTSYMLLNGKIMGERTGEVTTINKQNISKYK